MAIVFLDLDGTLLYKGKPAPKAVEAIRELKKNGHIPVIATGRVPYTVTEPKEALGIDSYICTNGTYIVHESHLVLERPVPLDVVKRLFALADEWDFDIVMEGKDVYLAYRKEYPEPDLFSEAFEIEYPRVDKTYHLDHPLLAFVVFSESVVERLRPLFPELVFNRSTSYGFDVNLAGDLKADGMVYLVDYLKLPEEEVFAIGDGYNDLSMIKRAHTGIAMGNAYPEVKQVADYVTTDVTKGGVYDALRHFKLIGGRKKRSDGRV